MYSLHAFADPGQVDEAVAALRAQAAVRHVMLAFETRASFVVGVAISVTTIPAAAYIGVAAGLGQWDGALGALTVLLVNLAILLLSGTVTLAVQALRERARGHRALPREGRSRAARQGAPPQH